MKPGPIWSRNQLESARVLAEDHFRSQRYNEPREIYLALFDEYQTAVNEVMEQTVDLTSIEENALSILSVGQQREVFRYLTGPPVSEDDLKVLMGETSISASRLSRDPELLARVVAFVKDWHDRRRFP